MLSLIFLHNSNFSSNLLPEAYSTSTFRIYCLHPLLSRFVHSFLCMYQFLYVQFSRCGLYKNRCWWMQKCYRNSSTGSTFAIFSWILFWKMCDRLATIRFFCYTCSCSRNSIDSFVSLYYYIWNDIGVSFRRSMLWRVSVFFFCFQLYYANTRSIHQLVIWFFFCFISVLLSSFDGIIISPFYTNVNIISPFSPFFILFYIIWYYKTSLI